MSDLTFNNSFTNFDLDSDAYAAFDATSLRDLIVTRLTDQNIFTDQVFEGSNMSSMIDIIAYSYHVLLFYLNRTGNEALFTESQLYENMNRIVKLLNYKPVGYQTSTLSFTANAAATLSTGTYTIPRYSFVDIGGVKYSLIKDATFSKTTTDLEAIASLGDENLLYQGEYVEYPIQTAVGEDFETIVLTVGKETKVETASINVYVKDVNTATWSEFTEVDSLYLSEPTDKSYEKRYNENGYYELKFGNGVNGFKLNTGDTIYVYYIKSNDDEGVVQAGAMSDKEIVLYSTPQFTNIKSDITPTGITYLTFSDIGNITLSNSLPSTTPNDREEVGDIRENAPKFFRSQQRLISKEDFETKIKANFGNILTDVKVLDNTSYINGYLKYLDTDLGLTRPNLESRVLLNQANFASSINFNNVYIVGVPRLENKTTANIQSNFLSTAQKQLIKNVVNKNKVIGSEIVFSDPVYVAFDICGLDNLESPDVKFLENSRLIVEPEEGFVLDKESIKQSIANILLDYFANKNSTLNQLIDFTQLSNDILNVKGVQSFYTGRTDEPTLKVEGLNLLVWNPVYETSDIQIVNQTIRLPSFKFPYWFNTQELVNKIIVE